MHAITRFALSRPKLVLLVEALITLSLVAGIPLTRTEVGYRIFLGDHHPAIIDLDKMIRTFGGGLPVHIAWDCRGVSPCQSVFDDASLTMQLDVVSRLESNSLVSEIESPATAPIIVPVDGDIHVRQIVENGKISADRYELAKIAAEDPLWRGTLVSPDAKVGAMVVQLASTESRVAAGIVPAIRRILADHEANGFKFYLVGDPVDFVVSGGQLQADTPRIVAVMLGFLIVAAWFLLRSLLSVLLALATSGAAVGWAMGAMSWLDWPEMELTQALRPGILVIALCTAIHVITRYAERASGDSTTSPDQRRAWITDVVGDVGGACLLTALTTAFGFLSFTTSGMSSFSQFGVTAAIGVGSGLLLAFTALPIALVHIDPHRLRSNATQSSWATVLRQIAEIAEQRPRTIFVLSGVIMAISIYGWTTLRVEVNERELFGENAEVVRWARFYEENLRKADTLEIHILAPEHRSFLELEGIKVLEDVSSHVEQLEGLGQSRSVLNLLSTANRAAHGGDTTYFRPADSHAGNAQLAFLLEMAPGSPLSNWISFGRNARVSIEADPTSTRARAETLSDVASYLESRLPPGWTYVLSGPLAVYLAFTDELQNTQLWSFGFAGICVTALLWIYFRFSGLSSLAALRWTFVGMFPSILPVVVTLGAMGIFDVPLDAGTAMVGAIILGIAVDDSIHLITAYRRGRATGQSSREAILDAITSTGQALVTSSIAISIGCFALMTSSWQSIASFGLLSGLAILAALIADLIVLPAIILTFQKPEKPPDRPVSAITDIPSYSARAATTLLILALGGSSLAVLFEPLDLERHRPEIPCSIIGNGALSPLSILDPRCPLKASDVVNGVSVGGRVYAPEELHQLFEFDRSAQQVTYRLVRSSEPMEIAMPTRFVGDSERTIELAVGSLALLSALFVGLSVLWLSSAQAAIPLAVLSSTLGVLSSGAVAGSSWLGLPPPLLIAIVLTPVAIIHLAMSFPRRSVVLQQAPVVLWSLYGAGGFSLLSLLWEAENHPNVWKLSLSLSAIIAGITWIGILVAGFVGGRNQDALERHRARLTTSASLVLVVLLLVVAWAISLSRMHTMALAALVLPLPIGYALVRYQFFDARPYGRAVGLYAISTVIYIGAVGVGVYAVAVANPDGRGVVQLGIAFVVLLAAEAIRFGIRSATGHRLPSAESRLHDLESRFVSAVRGNSMEEAICELASQSIMMGLASSGVSVALYDNGVLRIIAASGSAPALVDDLDELAGFLTARTSPVYLGPEGGEQNYYGAMLRGREISVVAPIRWNEELMGAALVSAPRDLLPYRKQEINFIQRICRHAAAAINNARLTSELLHAERFATLDWIATGLMHSVGRPMTIIARSTQRISQHVEVPEAFTEFLEDVRLASNETLQGLEQLRTYASTGRLNRSSPQPTQVMIERAVRVASRLHGGAGIAIRPAAELPLVLHGDDLQRVVTSLLDNALNATGPDDPMPEIRATFGAGTMRLEIVDFGCGMSASVLGRATEAFFTTRREDGGSGIGLLDATSTIERIGGQLKLKSSVGEGTSVTIVLPVGCTVDPYTPGLNHIQ